MKRCHFIPVLIFFGSSVMPQWREWLSDHYTTKRFPIANGDTAYDSRTYDSVQVMIRNIGNQAITDQYDVLIQGNTGITDTFILDTSSAQLLNPEIPPVKPVALSLWYCSLRWWRQYCCCLACGPYNAQYPGRHNELPCISVRLSGIHETPNLR